MQRLSSKSVRQIKNRPRLGLAATPNPTDLRNPNNELALQLPTLATEVGGVGKGQRSHRTWEGSAPGHTHTGIDHTHHMLRTRENLKRDYSAIEHSHTRTQRPQMTSGRVIWPLLFFKDHTLSRKKSACILQYINDAAYKRFAKLSGNGSSIIQA